MTRHQRGLLEQAGRRYNEAKDLAAQYAMVAVTRPSLEQSARANIDGAAWEAIEAGNEWRALNRERCELRAAGVAL